MTAIDNALGSLPALVSTGKEKILYDFQEREV
jgi:hypothetical protein